ncbi:MAG TPA: DUF420 domain-containing protein [Rhodospirillaceae bacterium]|nr:DUF420 domain-containing protein [Rhodospirillaceae bacterium]
MTEILPHLTAALNALAGLLLAVGVVLIRQGRVALHKKVMTAAVMVSALFLVAYLAHHFSAPVFVFPGQGMVRPIYFAMLISHVALAALVAPMIVVTFRRGRRAEITEHRRLARWTAPIWLYVSLTGIAVYLLLYHVYQPTT